MKLTESEKKELMSEKNRGVSQELLQHLKRNFSVFETNFGWDRPMMKFIKVDDKVFPMDRNKKYLVSVISNMLMDKWIFLGEPVIRRTVKKYFDGIKKSLTDSE